MTSQKNWRRKKTYIVEHFLPASILWLAAREAGWSHGRLALQMDFSAVTVQSTLAGKTNLPWDRAILLAQLVGLSRVELAERVEALEDRLRRELDRVELIHTFPRSPPSAGERLVMAYHIQDRLIGRGWDDIYGHEIVTSDMVWRARVDMGWSRVTAGQQFGVSPGTVQHWERANFPERRWSQADDIYGKVLYV